MNKRISPSKVHPQPSKRITPATGLASQFTYLPSPGNSSRDEDACKSFIQAYIKKGNNEPTDAFGEVEFGGRSPKTAKYVRVAPNTNEAILFQLLKNHWKLKTPNLVISVTGGARNFELRPRLKEVFRRSLIKASESTGAWITTGGTHAGVMKHVGKAVKNYAAIRADRDKVVTIGIATWGVIYERAKLVNNPLLDGLFPKRYDPDERDQGNLAILDYNHSHFILVDDESHGQYGREIGLRTKLEGFIATQKTDEKVNVMIVCVILQGGPGSLKTVHESIKKRTPVVVVEGSGGWADVLAAASRMSHKNITTNDIKDLLAESSMEANPEQLDEWTNIVKECVQHKRYLSVFDLDPTDSSKDLDIAILEALLKAGDYGDIQISQQLNLAMAWNRSDIARSHILTDDARIRKTEVASLFFTALKGNKAEFCKVFLDYGVDMKEYCTVRELENLYRAVPENSLLFKKLCKCRKDRNFTLLDVGQVMLEFLGHSYISVYKKRKITSKKYRATLEFQSQLAQEEVQNEEDAKMDDPYREIFQWAIMSNYREIARYVWEYMWESMSAAIIATKILKKLSDMTTDDKKEIMLKDREEYERLAVGILAKCFEENRDKTIPLLIRSLKKWGGYTCLHVAIEANNKLFVSRPAVQYFFDKVWMGKLNDNTRSYKILAAGLCPPLIWASVQFKENNEDDSENDPSLGNEIIHSTDIEMAPLPNNHEDDNVHVTFNDPNVDVSNSKKTYSWLEKLILFYDAPVVTFWMNVVSFLVYLILFASIILNNFTEVVSVIEYVVLGWISTFFIEEMRELADQEARYFKKKVMLHVADPWNIMDIASLAFFYIGFGLRWNASFLNSALILYSLSFMIHCVRIVHIFAVHHILGPKIIMVGKMVKDLLFFLFILVVFLLAYGVASQALLYPNESSISNIFVGIVYKPYWQIYGELFLDEINYNPNVDAYTCSNAADSNLPRCPQQTWAVPILSAVYLLFVNVLLLNLLIAMFSYTFEKVERQGNEIWKFQRYTLITDYYFRPPLVPPLIIITHVYLLMRFIKRLCCGSAKEDPFSHALRMDLQDDYQKQLNKWEHWHAEAFLQEERQENNSKAEKQLQKLSDRMDSLMSAVDNLQDHLKGQKNDRRKFIRLNDQMLQKFGNLEAMVMSSHGHRTSAPAPPLTTVAPISSTRKPKPVTPEEKKEPEIKNKKHPQDCRGHVKSRTSPYPDSHVSRAKVPDDKVPWSVSWPEYSPISYTHESVLSKPPWADISLETLNESERPKLPYFKHDMKCKVNRASHMGTYEIVEGIPRNPKGRTGISGRGLLGRYGPNHAADPVVTRWQRDAGGKVIKIHDKQVLEFVAIKRADTKDWAIPGGMVDPGEHVSVTLKREFSEEALNIENIDSVTSYELSKIIDNVNQLFQSGGLEIYKGYVDDHRNTDNAWIETIACNFHDEEGTAFTNIPLHPGEDAGAVCWKTVDHNLSLFASHTDILKKVAEMHNAHF